MGYTTTFEGRFDVYLPEGPLMAEFLRAIYAGDEAARRAFIDWLQEQGDPRGEKAVKEPEKFWVLFGLRPEHQAYLHRFSRTRRIRMDPDRAARLADDVRMAAGLPVGEEAGYVVTEGVIPREEDYESTVVDRDRPPKGQPGLYCQWVPSGDGMAIVWNGGEKFYNYVPWLTYLLEHFLRPWGYVVNGRMTWQGEVPSDEGTITVRENVVQATALRRRP